MSLLEYLHWYIIVKISISELSFCFLLNLLPTEGYPLLCGCCIEVPMQMLVSYLKTDLSHVIHQTEQLNEQGFVGEVQGTQDYDFHGSSA